MRSTFLWEYPADALKLGEYTSAGEALCGIECIEETDANLQPFTGKAAAAFGRKNETSAELLVLCVEGRCAADAEWEVQRAQGILDGFESSDVFMLPIENVSA